MNLDLPKVPEPEIRSRISRLQQALQEAGLDGALIQQNADLYYFSGILQIGFLYVPRQGEAMLWIRKSFTRAAESSLLPVKPLRSLKTLKQELIEAYGEIRRIGIEMDVVPYAQVERLSKALPGVEFADLSPQIRQIRMIKSPYEIEKIRNSAKVCDEAMQRVGEWIGQGIREIDLAANIEHYLRRRGHIGVTRTRTFNQELLLGAIISGAEAAVPSYFDGPANGVGLSQAAPSGAGWSPIRPNEPILIDFCTCVDGYLFDQTRTAVWGELDKDLEEAYQFCLEILREVERVAKPGVTPESLYFRALEMVEAKGMQDHFMGYGDDQVRFLGHGVGLEVDELPVLAKGFSMPLQPGMIIAIEPKFTFPGRGVVGIENTYRVTEAGIESLSLTPEEIIRVPYRN